MSGLRLLLCAALGALAIAPAAAHATQPTAPGAPGATPVWTPADKDGYGTSAGTTSKVWHTISNGELTEVFFPDLGTPDIRDLQLVVSDGRTFAERETDATTHRVELADQRSLTYRQIDTAKSGDYRITKTYVDDPARATVLVDVRLQSLTGKPYKVYALLDPSLSNDGSDDTGATEGNALLASDAKTASALIGAPAFGATSSGYMGASDGWTDLKDDFTLNGRFDAPTAGNVVQTAQTKLDGVNHRRLTVALGFGASRSAALKTAQASLERGFGAAAGAYQAGWHGYLSSIKARPASAAAFGPEYDISVMTLAAHEDKTFRGAFIASPTMPWAWGTGLDNPSDAYHLVWARDQYQIATALLAAGDRAGADRALSYLFDRQQKPDGSFPQNSRVDGTPQWPNLQLDEVALPIVLAWQLGRDGAADFRHVKAAADFIMANGPSTPQERWENQGGWSPATIASEIAALVCAADLARRNGDTADAARYDATADVWQRSVAGWTATTNGPYSPKPYYLRITKDAQPDVGTTYSLGDSGPSAVDQRAVVDPSFLELVRLGVKRPDDPAIVNTLSVVDDRLGVNTPNGEFWHRYDFDGYGETAAGDMWNIGFPADSQTTIGRVWPIFAGERGEYELAAGRPAGARLAALAGAANEGGMIPEQVWDDHPPSGSPGFPRGEGTFSATPLAWSHATFVRLAWSIQDGRPVEQPRIVACRYARTC